MRHVSELNSKLLCYLRLSNDTLCNKLSAYVLTITDVLWYGDGVGNTVEDNSSVFSLIRMR